MSVSSGSFLTVGVGAGVAFSEGDDAPMAKGSVSDADADDAELVKVKASSAFVSCAEGVGGAVDSSPGGDARGVVVLMEVSKEKAGSTGPGR